MESLTIRDVDAGVYCRAARLHCLIGLDARRNPRPVAVARGAAGRRPGPARVRRVRHALRRQAVRPVRPPELLRRAVPARGLGVASGCMRRRAGGRVRGVCAGRGDDGAAVRPRAVRSLRVRAVEATQARSAQVPAVPGARAVGERRHSRGRGSAAPRAARGRRQDRRRRGAATPIAGGRAVPRGAGLGGGNLAARR